LRLAVYIEKKYIEMESLIQVESEKSRDSSRPGPKSTHDEVRQRLVSVALEMMLEDGVVASLQGVSFTDVVDRSGVARATAYRALSENVGCTPSEWIRQELLRTTIRAAPGSDEYQSSAAVALKILQENNATLDHGTVREVTDLMRETIRVGCEANYKALGQSIWWRACIAMEGAIASQGDNADPELVAELEKSERGAIDDFAALYEALGGEFNLQVRPPYTWRQIAAVSASLVEGIALRSRFSEEVGPTMRPTGPGGKEVPWTLLGIGFEAAISAMTSPMPGRVAADLSLPDYDEGEA